MACINKDINSFGIHQVFFQLRSDPTVRAFANIVGDFSPELAGENIELRGGSNAYPFASAPGEATAEITGTVKQYNHNLCKILNPYIAGSQEENLSGEIGGFTSAIENVVGTSFVNATTGIASIAVDSATKTSLVYGKYIAVATGAATFDIYIDNDVQYKTALLNSAGKINSASITNPGTGATVVFQGIEFTAGSGASTLVVGDIAKFSVRPVNSYNSIQYIGKRGAIAQEFSMMIIAERNEDVIKGMWFPKCISNGGLNFKFIYKDFSTTELTIKPMFDCDLGYVSEMITIDLKA